MPTALIIVNGLLPQPPILTDCLRQVDQIICADGGANRACAAGIIPDVIVGDLDSITPETRAQLCTTTYLYRPSQYATDLEKTLQYAVEQHIQKALLVGMTGFRLDHQICNLHMMEKFATHLELELHDDFGVGSFLIAPEPRSFRFETFPGQQISLFAFRKTAGIHTTGLKYPLKGESLTWAVRDGLSNEALHTEITIQITQGSLFCYRVRQLKSC